MDSNYCKMLFILFTEEQIHPAQKKQHKFNASLNTYFEDSSRISVFKYLILIICPGLNFSLRQNVSRNRADRLFVYFNK